MSVHTPLPPPRSKVDGEIPAPVYPLNGIPFFEYLILWFWRICDLCYIKLSLITCRMFFFLATYSLFGSTEGELKRHLVSI